MVDETRGVDGDPDARHTRALVGAIAAPVFGLMLWFAPLALEPQAHRLAAIFAAVIALWVSEALPISVTALLIAPVMVAAGICQPRAAFAPYADPLLFLFVGGFMIARAMTRHGLDRRLALALATRPLIRGLPARIRAAFMFAGLLLSMWVSNTATTAMLMPILLGMVDDAPDSGSARATAGSLLAVAYACSIGGLGTPVGSPPNLIAMRFLQDTGIAFGFVDWVKVGLPAALVLSALAYGVFAWLHRPARAALPSGRLRARVGPWSRGERVTALAFTVAVIGWMVPGLLKAAGFPGGVELVAALPAGGVALFAAAILYAVPDGSGQRVLPWSDGVRIDWGIILLFGGGISLGRQMFETGLATAISRGFVAFTGVSELWTLTAIVIVFTIVFTEACSNTATSNMLSPLVIGIAHELGVSPMPPVIAVGLAASCAFMLPIATGPNAIAYGTGRVTLPQMMRTGFALNVACALTIFVLLRLLCPLYGWG